MARDNQPSPEVRSHFTEVTPTNQPSPEMRSHFTEVTPTDRTKTSKLKQGLDSHTPAVTIPKATITDAPSPKVKPTAKVSQRSDLFICPKCGAIGSKGIDFIRDTQSTARNLKLKCIHCSKSRVASAFKPKIV